MLSLEELMWRTPDHCISQFYGNEHFVSQVDIFKTDTMMKSVLDNEQ